MLLQWRITVDFLIDGFVYLSSRESLVSKKCILLQRSHHILESTSYKLKNAYGLLSIWSDALESLCLLQKIHILNWHVCYSRYLYIPLGGSKWRFLNVWIIFTFVAIWHDLEWWVPYQTRSLGKANLVRVQCNPDTSWLLQWDTLFSCSWSLGNGIFELEVWVTASLLEPLYLVMTIWQTCLVLL